MQENKELNLLPVDRISLSFLHFRIGFRSLCNKDTTLPFRKVRQEYQITLECFLTVNIHALFYST